jgi:hypothetical protein
VPVSPESSCPQALGLCGARAARWGGRCSPRRWVPAATYFAFLWRRNLSARDLKGEEREGRRSQKGREEGRSEGRPVTKSHSNVAKVGVLGTDTVKYQCRKQIASGQLDGSLDVTSVQKMCCKLTTLSHHRCLAYRVLLSRFSGSLKRFAAPRLQSLAHHLPSWPLCVDPAGAGAGSGANSGAWGAP